MMIEYMGLNSSIGGKPDIDLVCIHRNLGTNVLNHPERRSSTVAASFPAQAVLAKNWPRGKSHPSNIDEDR